MGPAEHFVHYIINLLKTGWRKSIKVSPWFAFISPQLCKQSAVINSEAISLANWLSKALLSCLTLKA